MQIEHWLRQADTFIRGGRYLAADEMLQKVFSLHPENPVALSYQDRIHFLINQLSQRVGLTKDVQVEVRKYKDVYLQRKNNQISSLLVSAQKLVEEGFFKKGAELANRALALDPENMYARALLQRLAELQRGSADASSASEMKFCAILKESWRDGAPSEQQRSILLDMQTSLKIPEGRRLELEREIRNTLYREALRTIWLSGGLAAFTPGAIDDLRARFHVARVDHSLIEADLLREIRKGKIRGNVLVVEGDESLLLELTFQLRSNFYAVIAAGNLDEALSCLKTATPDVVISETEFGGEQAGFDLYECIRSATATRHVPFIFLTAGLDRTALLIGKRMGVEEFLEKPVDYDLLLAILAGRLPARSPLPPRSERPPVPSR